MDRTIIIPYRAEEKDLSNILYNAIQSLNLLYPPTEDLRKCLSEDMFIKPNQQAFFHIMHYLFRLLDPHEFKKRFFWPITDKRSESNFRTSTVEYLKHINEKYQLKWTNIKSYLVVMPGGMKFISFLLDLVNFIVQEMIKQKEKQLNLDANNCRCQVREASLHKMCAKNEFFKGMASEFIDAVENLNAKYNDKSQKLMQHLEYLSKESGLSTDMLLDEKFLEKFEKYNYQLFDQYYSERSKKVLEMENSVSELKEAIDKFYSTESGYKYDKQRICLQLKRIRDTFPIEELDEEYLGSKVTDDGVNINTLILTCNAINETIQNQLSNFNKKSCAGEFVYSSLQNLKKELQEMENQITNFKKMLNNNVKKSVAEFSKTPTSSKMEKPSQRNLENNMHMKLVSTPPIKFELPEGKCKSRLALIDSKASNLTETTFNNFLVPPRASGPRQSHRNFNSMDQTISDLNNTLNRSKSKIIDPIHLLRSSSKKDSSKYKMDTTQMNISTLGAKWKTRQIMLNDIDGAPSSSTAPIDTTPKTSVKKDLLGKLTPQSLCSPFSLNDNTQIARSLQPPEYGAIDISNNYGPTSSNYIKKLSAVKKVQDASLHFADLSTSPSGRLEPLVISGDIEIPKLKMNDVSLLEHNLSFNSFLICEKSKNLAKSPVKNITENDETYTDSTNFIKQFVDPSNNTCELDEDALFNISDSVLKDVTL